MASTLSLALLALLSFISVTYAEDAPAGDVVVLTPENFDDFVGKDAAAFVEFYAPWCGHCKKLAPEYEVVGTAFKKEKNTVTIGKVDCDSYRDLCSRFDVSGYPTLKFFPKNSLTPEAYNGGRTADDIIEFVNKNTDAKGAIFKPPTDVTILTPENIDEVLSDKSKFVFVKFYAPWCGHCKALAPAWETLATVLKAEPNVVIAKCDVDEHRLIGKKYDITSFPQLKYFAPDNEEPQSYEGEREVTDLLEFVNEKAGTFRTVSGGLTSLAGKVTELDVLAQEYITAAPADREGLAAKIAEVAAASTSKSAAHYVKFAKNIAEKGEEYAAKETARLQRVLKGRVSPAKADEFTTKLNVLSSFLPKIAAE